MKWQAIGLLLLAAAFSYPAHARQWTDNTGKHNREAEFVKFENGIVHFTDAKNSRLTTSFDNLSTLDQQYVLNRQRAGVAPQAVAQHGPPVKSLSLRTPKTVFASAPIDVTAQREVFKLAGWSCSDGYCYYHPHPHPHPPHPPGPPLPVPGKRIYYGCWSTWHLVLQDKKQISGTGTYLVSVGPSIVRHLVLLTYRTNADGYLYYEAVMPPANGILHWRFKNTADCPHWYAVEWSIDALNWNFYEYCQVKLPQ